MPQPDLNLVQDEKESATCQRRLVVLAKKPYDNQAGLLPFFIEWGADTVHPSADAPSGCKFLRFELSAPNDAQLQRICTLLSLDVLITHDETPRLLARIAGPGGGLMELSS